MNANYDMPIVTQLLASDFYLRSNEDDALTLSPELRLYLDADIDDENPASPVQRYALQWWTNPDEDAIKYLSHNNIRDCLDFHCLVQNQLDGLTDQVPDTEPIANLFSAAPADPNVIRASAQRFHTIYADRRDLTMRRAAGFFMLSEAVMQKEDAAYVPPRLLKKKKTATAVCRCAVETSLDLMALPPTPRDLGM